MFIERVKWHGKIYKYNVSLKQISVSFPEIFWPTNLLSFKFKLDKLPNTSEDKPKYRVSSDYDGRDLHCFEVTNAPHKQD